MNVSDRLEVYAEDPRRTVAEVTAELTTRIASALEAVA
jgi:hypothetical protein